MVVEGRQCILAQQNSDAVQLEEPVVLPLLQCERPVKGSVSSCVET